MFKSEQDRIEISTFVTTLASQFGLKVVFECLFQENSDLGERLNDVTRYDF